MTTKITVVTPFKEKEFTLTEPLTRSVNDVKQKLSRLFNTTGTNLRLDIEGDELIDEETLEQVGCLKDSNMEINMTLLLPLTSQDSIEKIGNDRKKPDKKKKIDENVPKPETFDSFLANQPLNRRPKLIYEPEPALVEKDDKASAMNRYKKKNQYHIVDCPLLDGSVKQVKVEIDHMFGEKPFLGGFKHKITKKEYHHATSQTSKASSTDVKVENNIFLTPEESPFDQSQA